MSHRPHLGWSILGVSLPVLIISALAAKFSLGLLGEMSFFGITLGAAGVIIGIIIAVHERDEARHEARVIDELRAGEGVLVHWSYTPEEWNGFVAKVTAQGNLPWKILLIPPLPMVGFLWLLSGEVNAIIFIPFAVMGVIWMMIYLPSRTLATLGRGDVIISRDGVLIHDRWYDWSYGNRLLTGVTYEEGNPASILFKWKRVSGRGAWGTFSPTDVIVPVPHGHEKDAVHLVSTLSPDVRQQHDQPGSRRNQKPSKARSVPPPLPPSNRLLLYNTLVEIMAYTGIAVAVLALAAAFGEGSWAILGVAVSLIIFEVCAVFWGPSGGSAFALQALIQIALFSTFLYAALTHNRDHGYFSSETSRSRKTIVEEEKLTATNKAVKELDSGHPEEALRLFNDAVQSAPKNAEAYVGRGRAYVELGQTQRAIQDFDEAIRLDPKNAAAYDFRGDAYRKLGQTERAIKDFDQALKLAPTEALYYVDRGNAYDDLGQSQRAIENYDAAVRIDQQDAGTYYNRAIAYNKLGQKERAIQDYSEAIRLDPKYTDAYIGRGNLHADLDQTQQAIEDYDAAIRIDQEDAAAYYDRAIVYNRLGQKERAIQDYSEAIRLDPGYADAYDNRGLVYRALGKTKQAQNDFDRAKKLRAAK